VRLHVGEDERIVSIEDAYAVAVQADPLTELRGTARRDVAQVADASADVVVPGLPDAHCHAFQHGIAGVVERAGGHGDSFWT
jgi:cytosine/adenosine deaminase-related metal-dependent hydrolase